MIQFFVLVMLLALGACIQAPPAATTPGNAATTTSTGWKEGYGGDSIALEAFHMVEAACFSSRKLKPYLIERALETDKNVADSICNLLNTGELNIESVKQPNVDGVDKDAANYPNVRPRRLEIKKDFWKDANTTVETKEKMLLHEILPLVGLGDKDYVRSTRLQVAIMASRGADAGEVQCARNRIYAQLSGAPPMLMRGVSRALGELQCRIAIPIFADTALTESFADGVLRDSSHSFLLGAITGLVRTLDEREIRSFETLFVDAYSRLPFALDEMSAATCGTLLETEDLRTSCGAITEFLFGATLRQKKRLAGENGSAIDFDRASLSLAVRLRELAEQGVETGLITKNTGGRDVNIELIKSAVRSQNWLHLEFLGLVHRSLHSAPRSAEKLTRNFNWKAMLALAEASTPNFAASAPFSVMLCTPDSFRDQVNAILDGDRSFARCGDGKII